MTKKEKYIQTEKEIKYKAHQLLLKKIAYKFHHKTGIDVDELLSEANVSFCKSYHKWNPERGDYKTYLMGCVYNRLNKYLRKTYKQNQQILTEQTDLYATGQTEPGTVERALDFKNRIMNNDNVIIREIYRFTITQTIPKKYKTGGLYSWLKKRLKRKGRNMQDIKIAYDDVRTILNELQSV